VNWPRTLSRRDLLWRASIGVLAGLVGARAGAARIPRIGLAVLGSSGPAGNGANSAHVWMDVLRRRGLHDGKNVEYVVLQPWGGDLRRYADNVRDVVTLSPDVIISNSTLHTRAVQKATSTIPVVFVNVADPLSAGFVQSLGKPGGNITGVAVHNLTLFPKRLQLIRELLPAARQVGLIIDGAFVRNGFPPSFYEEMRQMAKSLDLALIEIDVERMAGGIDEAFQNAAAKRVDMVLPLGPWPSVKQLDFWWREGQWKYRIPVMWFAPYRGGPLDDVLVQYGVTVEEMMEHAAEIVLLILKGVHPRDIPVRQADKVELIFNLKAAQELGISVPMHLLARANRIIE